MNIPIRIKIAAALLAAALSSTVSAATHYVALDSPNPTAPYTDWATAAHVIQQAVDAAAAADEIVVTNGVYNTGGRIMVGAVPSRAAVDKAVALRSVNGPELTLIQGAKAPGGGNGNGAIRCVSLASGASLYGFTLTSGATRVRGSGDEVHDEDGGGVWCDSTNALVVNCTLTRNTSGSSGGGAWGATLNHCTITYNAAGPADGGGAAVSVLNDCTITGNSIGIDGSYGVGGGIWNSIANRCIITNNTSSFEAGGVGQAWAYNCIVSGNSAPYGGGAWGAEMANCTLTGNTAGVWGGGALCSFLTNCVLTGNSAGEAGGGTLGGWQDNPGVLNNCTLTGNSAPVGGGAVTCTLNNCILYNNTAPDSPNYSGGTLNYCCATPLPAGGIGNIALDPQLADAMHLSPTSPCRSAGSAAYATGVDIDGELWATPPSIGCDEFYGAGLAPVISTQPVGQTAYVGQTVTLSVGAYGSWPLAFQWWKDGAALKGATNSTLVLANVAVASTGDYTVVVSNALGSTTSGTAHLAVSVRPWPYFEDFEGSVGPEWSNQKTDVTPAGGRRFLGQFGNDTVTLNLTGLPAHQAVTISCDLFVIQSWDADGSNGGGPDVWDLSVASGTTLLHTTFSNTESSGLNLYQAFPGNFPDDVHPARTGAVENNSLGYALYGDAVYHLTFTFPHTGGLVTLNFSGLGLQDLSDESWGLDNVSVDLLPTSDAPPRLTRQPQSLTALSGTPVTFEVVVWGTLPVSYQWRFNGTPLPGLTTNLLTLSEVQKADSGYYDVVVANNYGSITSRVAVLTVLLKAPEITTQPTDQSVLSGSAVSLSVAATGSLPMTYQWQRNDADLSDGGQVSGAKTSTLTIAAVGIEDVGVYSVVVTNTFGDATSQPVALDVVMAPPRITTQPQSQAASLGSMVSLDVQATGSQPLAYEWQFNGVGIVDGPRISGARTSTLELTNLSLIDLGSYSVKVSNALGWVRSVPVELKTWSAILFVVLGPTRLVVTWNETAKGMTLQRSSSLSNPTWEDIADSQGTNRMSFPMTEAAAFFRLAMGSPSGLLAWIPPGSFMMGSPTNEVDRWDCEGPQTAVTISRGYWMGKHEVTQGEYLAVMGSNPSYFSTNNGYAEDLNRPVETVSWYHATDYCTKLTALERAAGRIAINSMYRLPTEAEWEYACRAGTSTRFSYGDDPGYTNLTNYAWYGDNSNSETHAVGQKLPNAWGLYDMYGNVYEWCQDWWSDRLSGGIAVDPRGPVTGADRAMRGGHWLNFAGHCRSAIRYGDPPDTEHYCVGFRVVLAPGQP